MLHASSFLSRLKHLAHLRLRVANEHDPVKVVRERERFVSTSIAFVFLVAYSLYFFSLELRLSFVASAVAAAFFLSMLMAQLRLGSTRSAGNLITLTGYLSIMVTSFETNADSPFTIIWLLAPPIYNMIFVGRRSGLIWIIVTVTSLAAILIMSHEFPAFFPRHSLPRSFTFFQIIGFSTFMLVLFFIHESERRAFQRKMIQATLELRKSNQRHEIFNDSNHKLIKIIGHDVRGPLQNLAAVVGLINSGRVSELERSMLLLELQASLERTASVVDNILQWSFTWNDAGLAASKTRFNLGKPLHNAIELNHFAIIAKRLTVEEQIGNNVSIYADCDMLEMILRNLISNAVKFSNEGERIVISAKAQGPETIVISITDSGPGIPKSVQERLFSAKISQRGPGKDRGLGIGLNLCKELIVLNGGTIWIDESSSKGTRISISLPGKMLSQFVSVL
jgi:two-component system, sensor histidine kinase and response regulator